MAREGLTFGREVLACQMLAPGGLDLAPPGRRVVWYEKFTGRSIVGVSLQEQNDLCDAIARRFRAYTDGRRDAATGCSADSP